MAAKSVSDYFNTEMIVSCVVAIILLVLLFMGYQHFFSGSATTSITKVAYDKLSDTEKAKYVVNATTGLYDIKK